LQKGFGLFVVMVGSIIPWSIIYNDTISEWQGTAFYSLQVFVHCILLGLFAFDYAVAQKHNRGWRIVFELHGLPSIGLTFSSIFAAIGAGLVALITNQFPVLITEALRFVIPIPPIDLLGR
jgi:hypothetical protein